MPLRAKLLIAFLTVAFLTLASVGTTTFVGAQHALQSALFDALTAAREIKARQIENHLDELMSQADLIAAAIPTRSPPNCETVNGHLSELRSPTHFHDVIVRWNDGRECAVLGDTMSPTPSSTTKTAVNAVSAINATWRRAVDEIALNGGFRDFAPLNGVSSPPLALVASRAVTTSPTLRPMVVGSFDNAELNHLMIGDKDWASRGMGRSGEIYLVGADYVMRTDSRFVHESPSALARQLRNLRLSADVINRVMATRTTVGLVEVRTDSTRRALAGESDTRLLNDYRDVPVISSFAPITRTGLRWAILSEIDTSEGLAPVATLRERLLLLMVLCTFLAAVAGAIMTRVLTQPLSRLASVMSAYGQGATSARAAVIGRDEIATLGRTFNTMADTLESRRSDLERELTMRRRLEADLIDISEREQKRIGQDLHDGLTQQLVGIKMMAGMLERSPPKDHASLAPTLQSLVRHLDRAITSTGEIAHGLCPEGLLDEGLGMALKNLAVESSASSAVHCQCDAEIAPNMLTPQQSIHLFRIAQESIANAVRHGEATNIDIRLAPTNDHVTLTITSDGRPFNDNRSSSNQHEHPRGLGLRTMEARADIMSGRLTITSGDDGTGTRVECEIPRHPRKEIP